ncbi:hypothetical protein [Bacteroides cellulosilyticus]|jgi:hypothetical protein|uniref:hypothetical protein n=1 Tax=Bacteroides cellulosilyticus TaxID=246787 RepID=UPI00101BFF2D|nr:hypothetical protein [Bacteroides cellulosilyticus]
MKSDLMEIFGTQVRWFAGLDVKQRFYVLYFLFSFSLLLLVNCDSLALTFILVLNFFGAVRRLKYVPLDGLED